MDVRWTYVPDTVNPEVKLVRRAFGGKGIDVLERVENVRGEWMDAIVALCSLESGFFASGLTPVRQAPGLAGLQSQGQGQGQGQGGWTGR